MSLRMLSTYDIKNNEEFFPKQNKIYNKYGSTFIHFNTGNDYEKTINMFKRRFERLYNVFKNTDSRFLLVYTSESDIYGDLIDIEKDKYNDILKIRDFIIQTYNNTNFDILIISTNKYYNDEKNIINYTINVDKKYLSNNLETSTPEVINMYREKLYQLFVEIFRDYPKNK